MRKQSFAVLPVSRDSLMAFASEEHEAVPRTSHTGMENFARFSRVAAARRPVGSSPLDLAAGYVPGGTTILYGIENLSSLTHIGGIGSSVASPTTDKDKARKARADAYLLGGLNGSVLSTQLAMAAKSHSGSASEVAYLQNALNNIERVQPDVYAQAQSQGEVVDNQNGTQGLAELYRLGIGFNEDHMGYSSGSGDPPSDWQTQQLVNELRALAQQPPVQPGTTVPAPGTPGHSAYTSATGNQPVGGLNGPTPKTAGFSGTTAIIAILAISGAIAFSRGPAGSRRTYAKNPRRRRKVRPHHATHVRRRHHTRRRRGAR